MEAQCPRNCIFGLHRCTLELVCLRAPERLLRLRGVFFRRVQLQPCFHAGTLEVRQARTSAVRPPAGAGAQVEWQVALMAESSPPGAASPELHWFLSLSLSVLALLSPSLSSGSLRPPAQMSTSEGTGAPLAADSLRSRCAQPQPEGEVEPSVRWLRCGDGCRAPSFLAGDGLRRGSQCCVLA